MKHEILRKLDQAAHDCIEVPHWWLPEEYQDRRRKTHTCLRTVRNRLRKKGKIASKHQELKTIKAANIEQYRQQLENKGSWEYNENEDLLYAAQSRFYNVAIQAGMIEDDED